MCSSFHFIMMAVLLISALWFTPFLPRNLLFVINIKVMASCLPKKNPFMINLIQRCKTQFKNHQLYVSKEIELNWTMRDECVYCIMFGVMIETCACQDQCLYPVFWNWFWMNGISLISVFLPCRDCRWKSSWKLNLVQYISSACSAHSSLWKVLEEVMAVCRPVKFCHTKLEGGKKLHRIITILKTGKGLSLNCFQVGGTLMTKISLYAASRVPLIGL